MVHSLPVAARQGGRDGLIIPGHCCPMGGGQAEDMGSPALGSEILLEAKRRKMWDENEPTGGWQIVLWDLEESQISSPLLGAGGLQPVWNTDLGERIWV